ncbi:glycosyltransferase [Candidatus Woesearchaeota archaeon]|nr:glycosyltransferase [Candidatus Woesearchaeota archaeon]
MEFSKVTVVIPTFNEGANIDRLLELLSRFENIRVVVSDDGSKDSTKENVVKFSFAQFLDRSDEMVHGLTASVVDGIEHALTEYVIVMDGDLQHPPEVIPDIVKQLESNDIVVAVREKVASDWPWYRRIISFGATFLAKLVLFVRGTYVSDPMSGFFGVKKSVFLQSSKKRFVGSGYKVLLDFLKQSKVSIGIVPYVFGARDAGSSKLKLRHYLLFLKSLFT